MLTAAIRAVNAEQPDAVLLTGDLLDNAQRNELDQFLARRPRRDRSTPTAAPPGYHGVQAASNPDGFFYRPDLDAPQLPGLLAPRRSEPFFSPGAARALVPGARQPRRPRPGRAAAVGRDRRDRDRRRGAADVRPRRSPTCSTRPAAADRTDDAGPARHPARRDRRAARRRRPRRRPPTVPADPRRRHAAPATSRPAPARAAGLRGAPAASASTTPPTSRPASGDRARHRRRAPAARPASSAPRRSRSCGASWRAPATARSSSSTTTASTASAGGEAALRAARPRPARRRRAHRRHATATRSARSARRAGGYWRITTVVAGRLAAAGPDAPARRPGPDGARALETWMVDHAGGLGARDLAGRRARARVPRRAGRAPERARAAGARDRNVRLWLPPLAGRLTAAAAGPPGARRATTGSARCRSRAAGAGPRARGRRRTRRTPPRGPLDEHHDLARLGVPALRGAGEPAERDDARRRACRRRRRERRE